MASPIPTGDHFPDYPPATRPGGAESFSHSQYSEQPPQWSGEPPPTYGAPPPYQPNPSYQQQYQPVGAPPYQGYPPQYVPGMNPTNPLAIASLVLSLVGVSVIAVILGHIALAQIKRSNGYERGHGLAVAGLIIGYAEIGIGLIIAIGFFSLILIAPGAVPSN